MSNLQDTTVAEKIRAALPGVILLQVCGRGSYGEVYLARDASMRKIAVKIPFGENNDWSMEREGLNTYCQRIPVDENLITVYQISPVGQPFCYSMELAGNFNDSDPSSTDNYEPDTLALRLKRRGGMGVGEIADVVMQLCRGLAVIHENGLCHRDIKPGNIMFYGSRAKLGDIGLVSLSDTEGDMGTPAYMPPVVEEDDMRSNGERRIDCDLYALGMTIYCMMSALLPRDFPLVSAECMNQPGMIALNDFVLKACDNDWRQRFATLAEFEEAFQKAVAPYMLQGYRWRRWVLCANVFIAVMLLAAGMLLYRNFFSERDNRRGYDGGTDVAQSGENGSISGYSNRNVILPTYAGRSVLLEKNISKSSYDGAQCFSLGDGKFPVRGRFELYVELNVNAVERDIVCVLINERQQKSATFEFHASKNGLRRSTDPFVSATPVAIEMPPCEVLGIRILKLDKHLHVFCNSMPAGMVKVADEGPWNVYLFPKPFAEGVVSRMILFGEAPGGGKDRTNDCGW